MRKCIPISSDGGSITRPLAYSRAFSSSGFKLIVILPFVMLDDAVYLYPRQIGEKVVKSSPKVRRSGRRDVFFGGDDVLSSSAC